MNNVLHPKINAPTLILTLSDKFIHTTSIKKINIRDFVPEIQNIL